MLETVSKILRYFPKSYINERNELVVIPKNNTSFQLEKYTTDFSIKCKLLELCSRACCKSTVYVSNSQNNAWYLRNIESMNKVLNTNFTIEDMELIYEELGNGVNHSMTINFISSGYDLDLLRKEVESEK